MNNSIKAEVETRIANGRIFGLTIPSYPFIVAVTGSGDERGYDHAWKIKNPKEFLRWVMEAEKHNKMFPIDPYYGTASDEDDVIELLDQYEHHDDFNNGYKIDFFENGVKMRKHAHSTERCEDCEGKGRCDGEECYSCEGTKKRNWDEDGEADYALQDGDWFPLRKLEKGF